MKKETNKSKYSTPQRVGAVVCVILILLVYIAALIFNILDLSWARTVGRLALISTFVLPALTWVYIWMVGIIFHKHTIADFDFGGVPTNHDSVTIITNAADKEAGDEDKQ